MKISHYSYCPQVSLINVRYPPLSDDQLRLLVPQWEIQYRAWREILQLLDPYTK